MMQWSAIRLFQRAMLLWVIGFIVSAYGSLDKLNVMGVSPAYVLPGPLSYITHGLALLPDGINDLMVLLVVPLLLVLCVLDLFTRSRWWTSLLIWFLYLNLMNRAWLAGSGGQQLIANLLFWNIFLSRAGSDAALGQVAFWILRLQLLIAYFATGLHKLSGTHWLDGTAMGIVASDPAFGPTWLVDWPTIATITTYVVFVFQLTFPLAVWFRTTRYVWILLGIMFHLGTALSMDIPEMGLAFIASYAIWLDDAVIERLVPLRWLARRPRSLA